jgi:hypothetical protein
VSRSEPPRREASLRHSPAAAGELELVNQFLAALANAAETGDREGVVPFLADDVEWVTP